MYGCSRRQWLALALWPLVGSLPVSADSGRFATSPPIRYRPPLRGVPVNRVASGSRGTGIQVRLSVLAPAQVGLSARPQPLLYWYMDQPLGEFMEISILEAAPRTIDSLFRRELPMPTTGGIHALALAANGVHLVPGIEYEWLVALVLDPSQRSYDIIASGAIRHELPPAALTEALAQAPVTEHARLYAEHGYWYDALHTLGVQIEQQPANPVPYRLRAELLRQVGLSDAAAYAQTQAG